VWKNGVYHIEAKYINYTYVNITRQLFLISHNSAIWSSLRSQCCIFFLTPCIDHFIHNSHIAPACRTVHFFTIIQRIDGLYGRVHFLPKVKLGRKRSNRKGRHVNRPQFYIEYFNGECYFKDVTTVKYSPESCPFIQKVSWIDFFLFPHN